MERNVASVFEDIAVAPLPQDVLELQETAEMVQLSLSSIPGNYREALKDHYYEKRPLTVIAEARGLSEGAAKSLLHRARMAFKAALLRLNGERPRHNESMR